MHIDTYNNGGYSSDKMQVNISKLHAINIHNA